MTLAELMRDCSETFALRLSETFWGEEWVFEWGSFYPQVKWYFTDYCHHKGRASLIKSTQMRKNSKAAR